MADECSDGGRGVDRRTVLATGAAVTATLSLGAVPAAAASNSAPSTREIVLTVNGADHRLRVDTRRTLLETLREDVGLTGSKKGRDQGQCGACTVHVDGERHLACLTLAVAVQGARVTTIEGLAQGGRLHPMQQAFVDHDAFQYVNRRASLALTQI